MRKYKVTFQFTGEADVEVEARDMETAVEKAREHVGQFSCDTFPVQDVQVVKAEEIW